MTGFNSKQRMAADKLQEPSATRPCRSCGGTGERWTGIDEAPTSICKPCDGTGQIALAQPAQKPVAHLWECLGRWSAYLVENGKQADCAPPSWLVDAINKATTPPLPEQEPEYWNVIDPAGNIVASETDAICGWARIAGSYKPTVEGLLGFHDQGWRVLPKVAPPAAQPAQEPINLLEARKIAANLLEARKIAAEYRTLDSQIDSGNLYFALRKCLEHIDAQPAQEPVADRLERLLWEYIDLQAAHPEHRPDLKTWPHLMIYAPQPAQEPVAFESFLESQDFYELMQTYRHCLTDALLPFEEVKDALRAAHIGSKP